MELFTIGSGYDEQDVREAARALTGYRADYKNDRFLGITFDPERHDNGVKRIFGKRGRFGPSDVLDLVTAHPRHAPFLVRKLWDFFIDEPPSKGTLRELERVYRGSRLELRPVVAAILAHPALYKDLNAPGMVKSPVVFLAGALRATGQGIDRDAWTWLLALMGQMPFDPPSVAGWDWGPTWLSTNSVRARFSCGNYLTERGTAAVPDGAGRPSDKPAQALGRALAATGQPWISARTRAAFLELAHGAFAGVRADDRQGRQSRADMLQRSLRHLLLTGPDAQLH